MASMVAQNSQAKVAAEQMEEEKGDVTTAIKLSMQRLRPAISKYLKMLDIHLDRLHRHLENMDKGCQHTVQNVSHLLMLQFTQMEEWTRLHQEQINATHTVQQVKATLRELQLTCMHGCDNQISHFQALLREDRVRVMTTLNDFLRLYQGWESQSDGSGTSPDNNNITENTSVSSDFGTTTPTITQAASPQIQVPANCRAVPDNTCAAASKEQLGQEMEELHATVLQFVSTVSEREPEETSQNDSNENPHNGTVENKTHDKVSTLKMAVLPVVGALIGGAMAGPVGLVAGIKIGALAGTVGGGVVGLAGGTILKKSQNTSSAKVCKLGQKDKDTTAHVSVPIPCPSSTSTTIPQPTSTQCVSTSVSQQPSVQDHVDNSPNQQCPDDSDDNGNLSFFDQILSWG